MSHRLQTAINAACDKLPKNDFFGRCLIRGSESWSGNLKTKSFGKSDAVQKKRAIQALKDVGLLLVNTDAGIRSVAIIVGIDDLGNQIYETLNGGNVKKIIAE